MLDENLPRLLARELPEFNVLTVAEVGWAGTKNGQLLKLAASEFDVLVTADRNLPHQQNTRSLKLGVVVLVAGSTKLDDLRTLAAQISEAVANVETGAVVYVPPP